MVAAFACFRSGVESTLAVMAGQRGRMRFGATPLTIAAAAMVLMLFTSLGCATYRDDLDRAMGHYNANEYDKSLVLLEVLEPDLDSLSKPQRAQYAYYRGMAHFRQNQKFDARHWLGRSAAREKNAPGSLSADEKGRLDDTLGKLNDERYGDASLAGRSCTVKEDCRASEDCVDGRCQPAGARKIDPPEGDAPAGEAKPDASADKAVPAAKK